MTNFRKMRSLTCREPFTLVSVPDSLGAHHWKVDWFTTPAPSWTPGSIPGQNEELPNPQRSLVIDVHHRSVQHLPGIGLPQHLPFVWCFLDNPVLTSNKRLFHFNLDIFWMVRVQAVVHELFVPSKAIIVFKYSSRSCVNRPFQGKG